jgi:hypothetical protein
MASTIDVQQILARVKQNEAQVRPEIAELRRKAEAVARASQLVGEAWSGSCMGHHTMLYFRNFQRPGLGSLFNVEWGTLNGVPPGWQERTVDEVKSRIQELSSVDLDALEQEYRSFEKTQTELRDDLVIELAPIDLSSGFGKEKQMLANIESVVFGREDEAKYIQSAVDSCPRMTRDLEAINSGRRVPAHTYYEAVTHKIDRGCTKAEDLWRTAKLLLRRLETVVGDEFAATEEKSEPGRQVTNIYNLHGPNARVNIRSHDSSVNISSLTDEEFFNQLRRTIESSVVEPDRGLLISEVNALEIANNSPGFAQQYQSFIASAANHITLIAPFIPALTEMLKNALK